MGNNCEIVNTKGWLKGFYERATNANSGVEMDEKYKKIFEDFFNKPSCNIMGGRKSTKGTKRKTKGTKRKSKGGKTRKNKRRTGK